MKKHDRSRASLKHGIQEAVRSLCQHHGLDVEEVSSKVAEQLQQHFAGERVYFAAPRPDFEAIVADFNGKNRAEVLRKHRISRTTFYEAIKSVKRLKDGHKK